MMTTEEFAFVRAIAATNDVLPQLIYADWLDDHGHVRLADDLRRQRHCTVLCDLFRRYYGYVNGYGSGYGYGNGYGNGYGDSNGCGYGYGGYGDGYGSGNGYGYGGDAADDGYGYGYGDGNGDGSGSGDAQRQARETLAAEETHMTEGQCYLFLSGYGWAWVGEYAGAGGLGVILIRRASNLCRTNGVSWFHLARGVNRGSATVRVIDGEVVIPTPVAIPWAGEPFTEDQN